MAESLRDQLAANLDKLENSSITGDGKDVSADANIPDPAATPSGGKGEAPVSKVAEAKEDKTGRLHGEGGKFVSAARAEQKPDATPPPADPAPARAASSPQRPSSWKKDYWGDWDALVGGTLTPERAKALADYMNERETQFQHGVATYKQEWEQARPVMEAIQPYLPLLQQHGIAPNTWISNLGAAHRELALGSPQQKLARFQWLAQQYGIPMNAFSDEAARNQFVASQPAPQPVQTGLTEQQARSLFQQEFMAQQSSSEVARFAADKEKYPHYEAVRETMAQLLEANLADDLPSAYEAALAHPRHSDIRTAIAEQQRAKDEEERKRAEAERVARAKGKAVSVRSATPTAAAGEKPKDRRSQLEEAFDEHMGGARV